jgi:hypothetical protein
VFRLLVLLAALTGFARRAYWFRTLFLRAAGVHCAAGSTFYVHYLHYHRLPNDFASTSGLRVAVLDNLKRSLSTAIF